MSDDQPRCGTCKRWVYPGDRHVCTGDLNRCANPRCRRLLPFRRSGLCMRCEIRGAVAELEGAAVQLPANTARRKVRQGE